MSDRQDNLAAVLHDIEDLRLEQRPMPIPQDDEVLLQMGCVGICGSDVHYLTKGRIGGFVVKEPMVLGHEGSGIVVKLGENVRYLKVGDKVAIEPAVPCRKCDYCREGKYNLCHNISVCATPPNHGILSRYFAHAADYCHKLPHHVSLEEGALLETLAVGLHTCKRAEVRIGSKLLVCGAGPIGLTTMLCAKVMGASKIVVTETCKTRLEVAKTLGVNSTIHVGTHVDQNVLVKAVYKCLGTRPDISIDCSGAEEAVSLCIEMTKSGGVVVLAGMSHKSARIPLENVVFRELDLRGVIRYCNDYPLALEMISTGKVNLKHMISHNFKLEEAKEAFEIAKTKKGNPVKIMIHCLQKSR